MISAIRKSLSISFLLLLVLADARLLSPENHQDLTALSNQHHSLVATLPPALFVELDVKDQTGEDAHPAVNSAAQQGAQYQPLAYKVEAPAVTFFNRYQLQPRTTQGPPVAHS
ncbi:hypothetical protein FT643_06145 [Ketobacter sp. MCCC 1A13808]|uniref:hypothetical protein n=1 Tax=Ketobacter sp. MCCC 1A13808 TaxID=2602738 RepID=UPI0012EBF18D|nr:hypothetical protein [Ketobacter sp. MCCC 1A13808]MVF11723.1 hypothetical protein [Ketobacter sp. MCCC 1A13808]